MNDTIRTALLAYAVGVNMVAFLLMGVDKSRAQKHRWRIAETTLFAAALLGGSAGAWFGMYAFHHKTKHWYFVLGMPLILALQAFSFWWIFSRGLI